MGYAWETASGMDDVQDDAGPLLVRFLASPMRYGLVCSLCAAASKR